LGEYFGGEKKLNQEVFSEFVDLVNFQELSIDDSLRTLLEYFTLPGES